MNNPRSLKLIHQYVCASWIVPLLLLALPAVVQAQFNYTVNGNGTITITRYTGPGGAVNIPSTINGLPVTSIGAGAFIDCYSMTGVTIPQGITSIGNSAFSVCSSLTSITIPDSVTNIGTQAFWFCHSLTYVVIGSGAINIGSGAFGACDNLYAVTVDALNPAYSSVASVLFDKNQTTLIKGPKGGVGSYTIPGSVTSIGDLAFYGCYGLTNVTIPGTVTNIGVQAFCNCGDLAGVYFQGNAPGLGQSVFDGDGNTVYCLTGTAGWAAPFGGRPVVILNPSGGPFIIGPLFSVSNSVGTNVIFSVLASGTGPLTYQWWKGLTSLTGATNSTLTITNLQIADAGSYTVVVTDLTGFTECLAMLTVFGTKDGLAYMSDGTDTIITKYTGGGGAVIIPGIIDGLPVTSIGDRSFDQCTGLTSLTMGSSVTRIGSAAFNWCFSLTNFTIPNTVTSIGDNAFCFCHSLTNFTIPNSVTNIGSGAFSECYSLTSVTIPNSVTRIGSGAFSGCTSLTAITVETFNPAYTSVDGVLFDKSQTTLIQCPGGKTGSYTIPLSVTNFDGAFRFCLHLSSVTIPDTTSTIGDWTFQGCLNLTNMTIPKSVTSIGDGAFYSCTSLTSITIPSGLVSLGPSPFRFCASLNAIIVEASNPAYSGLDGVLFNKSQTALIECPEAKSGAYIIPEGVTNFWDDAFDSCSRLTSIQIPSGVTDIGDNEFYYCTGLTNVTIPGTVTNIGVQAFLGCVELTQVYFQGNAPTLGGPSVFAGDDNATVYWLAGTVGWGATYGGRPTALWNPSVEPSVIGQPQSVSNNVGATVSFTVLAGGTAPLSYQWWKGTSNLTRATNMTLTITNVQPTDAGDYTVVVTNLAGAVTSQVATLTVFAVPPNGLIYTTNNDAITITGYTGPGGAVNIPSTINGLPVNIIGDYAFYDCTSVTSLTIPDSVVISIGSWAFFNCTNLSSLSLGNRVIGLGDGAFYDCTSLTSVTLPNSVTTLGNYTFEGCTNLSSVTIPNSVTYIGQGAFTSCTSLTNLMIPNSVTLIGDYAFIGCSNLASVTIPDTVTRLGWSVFANCTSLTGVTIPDGVTNIEAYAFSGCTSLTSVMIPANVTNLSNWAFLGCTSLTAITVDSLNASHSSVDGILFDKAQTTLVQYPAGKGGGDYTIPNSVTGILSYAFAYCAALTSVAIPDSVLSIGADAFTGCTRLTNTAIPNSVASIEAETFRDCASLTSLTIPNSVTNIGSYAFGYCTSLKNLTIPNSVTSIEAEAFWDCASLTSLTIPNGVANVGSHAFGYCTNLTNVSIANDLTNIGEGPFYACANLSAIEVDPLNPNFSSLDGVLFNNRQTVLIQCPGAKTGDYAIPNTVTDIEREAFAYCANLTKVTIPTNVRSIESYAFYRCSNLSGVYFRGHAPNLGSNVFDGDDNATTYYLPGTSGWGATYGGLPTALWSEFILITVDDKITIIGYVGPAGALTIPDTIIGLPVIGIGMGAFSGNYGLTTVAIPDTVTRIYDQAFISCTNLTSLTIPGSVTNLGDWAFASCSSLASVYFYGNAPSLGGENIPGLDGESVFYNDNNATVFYLPGTTGWAPTFGGLPAVLWNPELEAQFNHTTTNGVVSITGYTGPGGSVTIPNTIDGLPVVSIANEAFYNCLTLTNLTIPTSVTRIGDWAFGDCPSLTSVSVPSSVTNIGDNAFGYCLSLSAITVDELNPGYSSVDGVLFNKSQTTLIQCPGAKAGNYRIPNGVTNLGIGAFQGCSWVTSVSLPDTVVGIGSLTFAWCTGLNSLTIPGSVTTLGIGAFAYCTNLAAFYFQGNAPALGGTNVFVGDNNATVYYLPGTSGWGAMYGGLPTALWNPPIQTTIASFGVWTNRFGFTITGTSGLSVVVEASTDLANPAWIPLATNTLTSGSSYFSDPQWTNCPGRFYRVRSK